MALSTSSTVSFEAGAGRSLVVEEDNDDTIELRDSESLIRVYPSSASPKVRIVKGLSSRIAGTSQPKEVDEWLSFTGGSTTAALSYVPTGSVLITEAKFFNASVVTTYNPDSNEVVITKAAPGVLRIRYTTYYDRYILRHETGECGHKEAEKNTGYEPVFLVAQADGYEDTAAMISGPSCPGTDDNPLSAEHEKYEPIGIKLEVDPFMKPMLYDYSFSTQYRSYGFLLEPVTLTEGEESVTLYCGCKVRVYPPDTSIRISVINGAIGNLSEEEFTRRVQEALSFSGGQSTNLTYPTTTDVSLTHTSSAVSLWGEETEVNFYGPGDHVKDVKWSENGSYTVVKNNREVRADEVVSARNGYTYPCYTHCQASYTAPYRTIELMFDYDSDRKEFKTAILVATDENGKIMGSISINPPSMKGVI